MRLFAQLTSSPKRRFLLLVVGLIVVTGLPFLVIQVYYGNGLPESLVFRRTARHFCIKCGSQGVSDMTELLDGLRAETKPKLVHPRIEGIDAVNCDHTFLQIAAHDRFISFPKFQKRSSAYGKLEGEPIWSSPSLIRAFSSLSRTNREDAIELFSFLLALKNQGRLSRELLEAVTGTNAADVIPSLQQSYSSNGNVLASRKRLKWMFARFIRGLFLTAPESWNLALRATGLFHRSRMWPNISWANEANQGGDDERDGLRL